MDPGRRRRCTRTPGSTKAVLASTLTLADAEQQVLDFIRQHVPEPRKAPLCGNSIATDRGFLARDMPDLDDYLHYRMVDVSSVKELARRWYPRAYYASPEKQRRPPGARRHPGERRGAALLPRGRLRAAARPDDASEAKAIAARIRGEDRASRAAGAGRVRLDW